MKPQPKLFWMFAVNEKIRSLLVIALLALLSGCLPLGNQTRNAQDGGPQLPEPPHWARINRFSVSPHVGDEKGTEASISSLGEPSYLCGAGCKEGIKIVTVIQAPMDDINAAVLGSHSLTGTNLADITPDKNGFLPRVQTSNAFYSDPIVLAITDKAGEDTIEISRENIEAGRVVVFIPGDANLDGFVDQTDADIVMAKFNGSIATVTPWQNGDFNADGYVDAFDFALVNANLNTGLPFRVR